MEKFFQYQIVYNFFFNFENFLQHRILYIYQTLKIFPGKKFFILIFLYQGVYQSYISYKVL